jgi:hypothetical protein
MQQRWREKKLTFELQWQDRPDSWAKSGLVNSDPKTRDIEQAEMRMGFRQTGRNLIYNGS